MSKDTVILLFSRADQGEVARKTLAKGRQNHSVHALLHRRAAALVGSTSMSFIVVDETSQEGHTFGERLAHAFQSCYALGYQSVIAIGNDCLHLDAVTLQRVRLQCGSQKAVLGADQRGGAYLIALHKSQFNRTQFAQLPWQQSHLFETLERHISEQSASITQLEVLPDINSIQELRLVLVDEKLHSFWILVLRSLFISPPSLPQSQAVSYFQEGGLGWITSRGPPVFI